MNSDKEKTMSKGDRSDSSSKVNAQQNERSDKKQSDHKDDRNQQGSGTGQSKFGKQNQTDEKQGQTDDKNKRH